MSKEPQVGTCKKCRDNEICEFSSAEKEQCNVVYGVRDKEHRCLLEKGHKDAHTWWNAPCLAMVVAPNPYSTPEYIQSRWDTI